MQDNENDNKFHDNKSAWNTPVTDLVDDDSSTVSTGTDTSDVADLGNFDDVPKGVTNKLRRISQDNLFLGLINGNAQRNGGNNVHEQQNNVDFWSMHSNDSNPQEGFSPIGGNNNGGTVRPKAGSTDNFKSTQNVEDWFASSTWWNNDDGNAHIFDNENVPKVVIGKVNELDAALHNDGTARLEADSPANWDHFSATASEAASTDGDWEFEPAQRNDINPQGGFSPIWGNNNGTVGPEAGFTNNFAPVINNDEGYNSDPDFGNNLDNGSKADDKPGRLVQIRQEGAKLFGIAGKSFSKLSARDQVLVGAAIGALVTIALPALLFAVAVIAAGGIIAAAGALIGAVVGAVLYAGVKTVQGINWAAQKTIEGAKSTARNITSGVSRTVANVGAKIQYSATETDYQEKLRRLTDAQNESYDEVKRVYNQEVEGVSDDVGLSKKEKQDITEAILNSIVSKLNSEIEGVKRNKQEAESAEEVKDAEALLDQLTQKRDFFAGLDVNSARKLFSGQQTAISNKDRYSFVTVLAGNSDKIIGVISMEVQKAYDEKSKLANKASNAESKPKLFGLFNNRKPKAVAKVKPLVEERESTNTSTTTLASESSPMSGNDKGARVHFADVLNQGETIPIVTSRRVIGYGTVSSSNSIFGSDNTLNNGSGDSGINSPVEGSHKRMNDQTRVAALTKLFENLGENPDTDVTLKPSDVNQHASTSALGQAQ